MVTGDRYTFNRIEGISYLTATIGGRTQIIQLFVLFVKVVRLPLELVFVHVYHTGQSRIRAQNTLLTDEFFDRFPSFWLVSYPQQAESS